MKDVIDPYPIQLVEFALEHGLSQKSASKWWAVFAFEKYEVSVQTNSQIW